MKYKGKVWHKLGRGKQSEIQIEKLGEVIDQHPTGAVSARLNQTGGVLLVLVKNARGVIKEVFAITAEGEVTHREA